MRLYDSPDSSQFVIRKPIVPGQRNVGFQPELGFARRGMDVHLHSFLLSREKEKAVATFREDSWAHGQYVET